MINVWFVVSGFGFAGFLVFVVVVVCSTFKLEVGGCGLVLVSFDGFG